MCKPSPRGAVGTGMTPRRPTALLQTLLLSLALATALGCARDARPTAQDPGIVTFDTELGHAQLLADQPGEVLARLRVGTRELGGGERPPLNLALVVDTSGSMMGEAIDTAREATRELLGLLRDGDRVSVTVFHSRAELLLESTVVGDADLDELRERLDAMEARGTTDLAGGLQTGLAQVRTHMTSETIDRVVLLGDGVPNDPSNVIPLAQSAGQQSIAITALGLGLEYDETLMGQIAQVSRGHFEYVEEPARVASVFRQEILRLDRLVGRGAVLALQPGPGVEILEVVGQQTPGGAGGLSLQLGDLSEGERREVLVRLSTPARRSGALVELLDATLAFQDQVAQAGTLQRTAFLGARANDDALEVQASRNQGVHEAAASLRAAEATLQAIQMVRTGQVQAATALLDRVESEMEMRDEAYRQQVESVRRFRRSLPSADDGAPAAAPAMEESLREAHDESMDALGY